MLVETVIHEIERLPEYTIYGRVSAIVGLLVEVEGLEACLSIGDHCRIIARRGRGLHAEVIGFRGGRVLLMPFGALDGVGLGCRVEAATSGLVIYPHTGWLGRTIDAFGRPIDGKGPLPLGSVPYTVQATPPSPHARQRLGGKIDLGIRSINAFLTCCRGQRMGIFSGSGVGKSTVLSMMARHTEAEVSVIGLVGERGREAREFIEDDLGADGMARSVVVVATSDAPPLVRRQAAYTMMTVAEFFRDQSQDVLCLMDSVTRFAMAQREIGLSVGSRRPPRATRLRCSRSCRDCWREPVPVSKARAALRACSPCLSKAMTTTSPSRTPFAVSSTATSFSIEPLPSAGASRRLISSAACRGRCRRATPSRKTPLSGTLAGYWRPMRTWPNSFVSAPTERAAMRG